MVEKFSWLFLCSFYNIDKLMTTEFFDSDRFGRWKLPLHLWNLLSLMVMYQIMQHNLIKMKVKVLYAYAHVFAHVQKVFSFSFSKNSVSNYAGFSTSILEYFNYSIGRRILQRPISWWVVRQSSYRIQERYRIQELQEWFLKLMLKTPRELQQNTEHNVKKR